MHRLALAEDREESRLRPVFDHVIRLPDEQGWPRLLRYDETRKRLHKGRLACTGSRADK